ncbi:MAG TPA: hypothetical protein VMW35_20130 [Myxococcota bacterium]|nr:hypothetical protein [Myxococcota bacterium]
MSSFAPPAGPAAGRVGRGSQFLVGRDLAATRPARRVHARSPLSLAVGIAALLVAALALASLRVQILDLRMRLGAAVRSEEALDQDLRALRVEVQELRSQKRLKERAAKLGFGVPKEVRELSATPMPARAAAKP